MRYAQKYCLVAFLKPIEMGATFSMADWPLHVTLADVFAIDRVGTNIEEKLAETLETIPSFSVAVQAESMLGSAHIVLLEKSDAITALHTRLIDLLESNDATFNTPEFTRAGYVPHCTIQKSGRLQAKESVRIDRVSLVDMFPRNNWRHREVLATFRLCESRTKQAHVSQSTF